MDAYNHGNPGSVREQRLNYFMENYLPKNEVLYRLPLDIQIEPFWAELQNRRKAGAVLSLESAAGMPYWYTLTKKMVAASTRLCGEALSCTEALDAPHENDFRHDAGNAYFTSFVEGAQISLEDSWISWERGGTFEYRGADGLEQPAGVDADVPEPVPAHG